MQTERKTNLFAFPRCSRYYCEAEISVFLGNHQTFLFLVDESEPGEALARDEQFDNFPAFASLRRLPSSEYNFKKQAVMGSSMILFLLTFFFNEILWL